MKSLLLLAAALAIASAHMCLIFPHQRGSMQGLNMPGATDCIHLTKPCGGFNPSMPQVVFEPGANVSLVFQKNLNHWDMATPGSFEIAIGSSDTTLKTIFTVPDTNTSSLTLYTPYVIMPDEEMDMAVLQATYVTNNTKAPAVFYQCADIMIKKM